MDPATLAGFVLTALTLIAFLVWTRREVGRIDDVIEQVDREHAAESTSDDGGKREA